MQDWFGFKCSMSTFRILEAVSERDIDSLKWLCDNIPKHSDLPQKEVNNCFLQALQKRDLKLAKVSHSVTKEVTKLSYWNTNKLLQIENFKQCLMTYV